MELKKLFSVLVVGGSLLASTACDGNEENDEARRQANDADAADGTSDAADVASDAAPADQADAEPTTGELTLCFCNTDQCCDRDAVGGPAVQEGFECCWGTTCP